MRITNSRLNPATRQITYFDYVADGIDLARISFIVNITRKKVIYNFIDPAKGGAVSGNIVTVDFDTTSYNSNDMLVTFYDDPDYEQAVNFLRGFRDDFVTAKPKGTTYKNIATSQVVLPIPGTLVGMYVNSTSSGTIKFWDNATAGSGLVLNNTLTPAVGWHNLGNAKALNGIFATITGTIDVTVYTFP